LTIKGKIFQKQNMSIFNHKRVRRLLWRWIWWQRKRKYVQIAAKAPCGC